MVPGAFVRVMFPTAEKPREPGPLHIGYVLGAIATSTMVAYTTSQPQPLGQPLPLGAKLFDEAAAARLNQSKAFILRLDLIAKVPSTRDWFPDIDRPDKGVIAVADARLQRELESYATRLFRRHRSLVQMRGV